jgi:4-oxalocrotonate tautomerase
VGGAADAPDERGRPRFWYESQKGAIQIVKKLTDAMVGIEGENLRPITWCVVEEVASGSWGIAGNPLTTDGVKSLAAGTA